MPDRKTAMITNLWSKVVDGENGEWLSRVVIESTRPYAYSAGAGNGTVSVECRGVTVNMPEGTLTVNDGLLREVHIRQDGGDTALVKIDLDHPADHCLRAGASFPFRLEVILDRSCLRRLFSKKIIVIDPGHGGEDSGGRGYVGLLEKNVVMPIAEKLAGILRRAGAEVLLTRSGDENPGLEARLRLAGQVRAHAFIGIHTHAGGDRSVEGTATLYAATSGESARLAGFIQAELLRKIKAKDRGVREQPALTALDAVPAVEVEVLSITNIVEEVYLRSLTLYKRVAEGIFNGLIKYFAKDGNGGGE